MTAPHRTPDARYAAAELADPLGFTPSDFEASPSDHDAADSSTSDDDTEGSGSSGGQNRRNAMRYRGILIAAGATLFLWAVVGLTLWGALSVFH